MEASATAAPVRQVLIPHSIASRAATKPRRDGRVVHLGGATMGTTWSARLVALSSTSLSTIERGLEAELQNVVAEMSTWEETSCISRFNRAPAGTWHVLPEAFFTVLDAAIDVARRTSGAYDPTVGSVVDLWGFGPAPCNSDTPDARALQAATASSGWERVALDRAERRAFQPGGVRLDLSSIAKGFAVDRLADCLRRSGVADFLVEIGGELRGEGVKPDGTPWWVLLETPAGPRGVAPLPSETLIALYGLAVATSGDYRRFRHVGAERYAHTIDPRTGEPVANPLACVTVAAPDCMMADAWATALMVLGPEAGLAFAENNGLAARFVMRDEGRYSERLSSAMAGMLG